MPAPVTPVLDTATRANEDPLANGWSGPVINGELQLKLVSNQFSPPTAGTPASSYWNAQQFAADQEAFFTMPTLPGGTTEGGLILRATNPGTASAKCILVDYQQTVGVFVFDVTAGSTFTQAGTTLACTMVAGDKLKASVSGGVITVERFTGGVWTLLGTRSPTTTGAGFIGMFTNGGTVALDDFGGGALGSAVRPKPLLIRMRAGKLRPFRLTPPQLLTSAQAVSITGLGSAASFGSVKANIAFNVTGLGSAAAFGLLQAAVQPPVLSVPVPLLIRLHPFHNVPATALTNGVTVSLAGLGSAAAFGSVKANIAFTVTGLGSAAAFSTMIANIAFTVTGKGSAAAFGTVTATLGATNQNVSVTGLGSAAAFGTVTAAVGNINVSVTGKGSAAAFGVLAQVSQIIHPASLGSAAAFGTVTVAVGNVTVSLTGRGSAALFGTVTASGGAPSTSHPELAARHRR